MSRISHLLIKVLLLELAQRWLDLLERVVDVVASFGTRQHNLSGRKYQQANLGLLHVINQARERLGIKPAVDRVLTVK